MKTHTCTRGLSRLVALSGGEASRNRNRYSGLTMSRLRRSLIYKPLVILMSILLLPAIPWVERAEVVPLEVEAQIGGCASTTKSIIRNYCGADGTIYFNDLTQLERDAVQAYLTEHGLPDTDAHVVYDYGRKDLRSKIRAHISSTLLGIIQKAPSLRSPHEKELYNWLQSHVRNNEINLYKKAIENYVAWRFDPCRFTLDPTLASAYGISYDGRPFCGNTVSSVFGVPAPAQSYFKAYGLKHSYSAPADTYPDYGSLLADMNFNVAAVAGTAAAAGAVITGLAAAGLVASYTAATSAWVTGLVATASGPGVTVTAGASAAYLISGATVDAIGLAAAVAGPVVIIVIAIAIGITAGVKVFENEANIKELNDLSSELARVTNTPPDLDSFRSDSTGVGLFKLQSTILTQTMPDVPSTTPLPAHRDGIDLSFIQEVVEARPTSYQDWTGNIWTVQTWGGWFVQTCRDGASSKCTQADSIVADLRYKEPHIADSAGTRVIVNWTASRFGSKFSHTRAELWRGYNQQPCAADGSTGVSSLTALLDLSKCSSYVDTSFRYVSGDGGELAANLVEYTRPVFSSPSYLSFTAGVPSTRTISATGNPKPTVFVDENGGTLTSNSDFTITIGQGTPDFNTVRIEFNGNSNAPAGDYTLNLNAQPGLPVHQTYTITVGNELRITSPDTLNGTAGSPLNFLVTATGSPTPKLSIDPEALVNGLTFTDNGNGTATISGVAPLPGEFKCVKVDLSTGTTRPCGIVASNTQGTIEQPFTFNLASSPTASVVPPIGATFTAGVENLVPLTSTGAMTPVSWAFFPDPSAPWLSLHDTGTGTAVLRGTPPPGTTGTFFPGAVPTALGSRGIAPVYPVTVVNTAVFTSPNTATFTVGSLGSFTVSANTGTINLDDQTLPRGLTFVAGNPASITGVAAAGTGGQYTVTLTDDAAGESATQSLTLNVNEAPQLTSANTATMFVGMPGSFAVTTTGFPSVSNHVIPANAPPPTSPDEGNGTYFTVTGLPAGLTFSNLTPQGFATGTLTIQGTPSAAAIGPHQVTITAQNGVGAAAQTLMLDIVNITGPAPVSGATCNGNYTGTFKGDITVSAGQNCAFYFGGVTGNVTVLGGSFAATEATITGNVSIQGAAGFSIDAGTTIAGNLTIQNVASASTTNQICGSRVAGNLNVAANAVPITIGSTGISCLGNSFGANVAITSNTAPIQVYQNDVEKNLSCSNNTSIAGGGNLAQKKKTGQCASF